MDRIDELLARATPNLARRNHLRDVFAEWERVKHGTSSQSKVFLPLIIREASQAETIGAEDYPGERLEAVDVMQEVVSITAVGPEEFKEIREELAEAGVPAKATYPIEQTGDPASP